MLKFLFKSNVYRPSGIKAGAHCRVDIFLPSEIDRQKDKNIHPGRRNNIEVKIKECIVIN